MIQTAEEYAAETGLSATQDLGGAMVAALARIVAGAQRRMPGNARTPATLTVETEWASYNDKAVPPCACVVADAEVRYDEWSTSPSILRDTWAREGERGMALYQEAEGVVDLKVFVRANNRRERAAVCMAVEPLLTRPASAVVGGRYGLVVPMPEYWGREVRFSYKGLTRLDSTESATKNRWEAVFRVSAEAPKVRLDVATPMLVRLSVRTDDVPA